MVSVLASNVVDSRFELDRIKPKTIKLVFVGICWYLLVFVGIC